MYTKVVLTLILLAMIAVAVGMWRPERGRATARHDAVTEGELVLRQRVGHLILQNVTREEAVAMLRKMTDENLVIDWASLSGHAGVPDTYFRAIRLNGLLGNLSLEGALKAILGTQISCQVDGRILTVTRTGGLAPDEMTVDAYDVSDLVSDDWWGVTASPAQAVSVQAARMEKMRDIVTQHTEDLGWRDNYIGSGNSRGGCSISVCGSCLIVTQTTDGQMAIANVLAELRRGGPR